MQLLPPLRFRFHAEDHEKYGDGWQVYDESALTRIPVRELIAIEAIIGMSLDTMRRRIRQEYADANLAATWLTRRQSGIVEDFNKYEPLITLMEWEITRPGVVELRAERARLSARITEIDRMIADLPAAEAAGDAVPPAQDSDSSQDPSPDSSTSSSPSSPSRRASRRVS